MLRWFATFGCLLTSGCMALPEIVHQPTLHNPFPQISKVAVATFFNASTEPTLDGRKVAEAYAAELAEVPGYVVIPVSQVDVVMHAAGLRLEKEQDARRLAQLMDVDAVVVGVVTEYTPYYPPRLDHAGHVVRGQSQLPSHTGWLWPAVGGGGGERHSRTAGVPGRTGLSERATEDANPALSENADQSAHGSGGATPPPAPAGGAACGNQCVGAVGADCEDIEQARRAKRIIQEQSAQAANPSVSPAAPAIFASGQAGGDLPPASGPTRTASFRVRLRPIRRREFPATSRSCNT